MAKFCELTKCQNPKQDGVEKFFKKLMENTNPVQYPYWKRWKDNEIVKIFADHYAKVS